MQQVSTLPIPPLPVSRTFPYDVSARELLMLATSKWPDMLAALESVEIAGVAPIGLEIAPAERRIRIEIEFADYPSLLRFIDGLNAGEPVQKWSLIQAQGANRPISAVVTVPFTAVIRGEW